MDLRAFGFEAEIALPHTRAAHAVHELTVDRELHGAVYADDIVGAPFAFALAAHLIRHAAFAAGVVRRDFESARAASARRAALASAALPSQHHHSTPASAIRRGDWKLIEFFEDGVLELYDLRADPGEQHNLAAREPARARELQSALAAWRGEIGARMPKPNPNHDPARATELAKDGGRIPEQ